MAKLSKREPRFSKAECKVFGSRRSFHKPQRYHETPEERRERMLSTPKKKVSSED